MKSKPEPTVAMLKRQRLFYALGAVVCLAVSAILIRLTIAEFFSGNLTVGRISSQGYPGAMVGSNGLLPCFAFLSLVLVLKLFLKDRYISAMIAYRQKLADAQETQDLN